MAFTTINIADLGITFDDPGFHSNGVLFLPDPAGPHPVVGGGARPVICGTHSPHFSGDSDLSTPGRAFTTFCNAGWICLAASVRSLVPFNGQTTPGTWPEQSDDLHLIIEYCRAQLAIDYPQLGSILNFVGTSGPSGAGGHSMTCTLEGTVGGDRADFCISCSGPTDYSNRNNVSSQFIFKTAEYADVVDTDLVTLRARSPIALITSDDKNIFQVNGTRESQPASQLTDVIDDFVNAGVVNYEYILNDTAPLWNQHAYQYWDAHAPAFVSWANARLAEFLGEDPPPPPEETGRVKVTALITGLAPGLELTLNVAAHDTTTNLDGPITTFDFISDRADTGGGTITAPTGIYALVDAVEGVITGTIGTRAWLGFSYVDGGTFPTTWKALNPTGRDAYDWSQTDAFMAALFANNKQGGIAVNMGIKNPLWIYSGGHAVAAVNVTQPNSGTIPIPWDANYLGVCKGFIRAFATKYDAHPNLSYIVVGGMGQLLETLLVQAAADYNNLNALAVVAGFPNLLAGWTQTSNGLLDMWSKAFPTTPVYLAIETPVPVANGGLVGIDEFARAAIDRYRARLGLMTLQLDGLTGADANLSLNSIIRDANRTARAYRFRYPSTDPNCDPSQAPESYDPLLGLQNAGAAGVAIGVQMEELYEADVLTVTGGYPAAITALQTDLTNNAI